MKKVKKKKSWVRWVWKGWQKTPFSQIINSCDMYQDKTLKRKVKVRITMEEL